MHIYFCNDSHISLLYICTVPPAMSGTGYVMWHDKCVFLVSCEIPCFEDLAGHVINDNDFVRENSIDFFKIKIS